MKNIRKRVGIGVVMALGAVGGAAVVACKRPLAAPTYAVTATFDNAADVPSSSQLSLSYTGRASSGPRLVSDEGLGFTFLRTIALAVTRGGTTVPTNDSYILQVVSRPSVTVDQTPDPTISRAGDWPWMEAHGSDIIVLGLQASTLAAPTAITPPPLSPQRTSAAAWLAAIETDDAQVPYFVAPGTPACHVVTAGDCFDVQTIAMTLLDGVVAGIRQAADPSGGGRDPQPLLRATGITSSIAYVPNVLHAGLNRNGRRVRGVGFVIKVTFEARAAGGDGQIGGTPLDVGSPYHRVTVWAPVALHFEDDRQGQVRLTIDPIDLAGSDTGAEMATHVAVEVENPAGVQVAGDGIAAAAVKVVTEQLAQTGPLANLGSDFLTGFFNLVRPTAPFPANFDVLLVAPTGDGTPMRNDLSRAPGASGPALVFLE